MSTSIDQRPKDHSNPGKGFVGKNGECAEEDLERYLQNANAKQMNSNQADHHLHNSLSDTYLPPFYTTTSSSATSTGLPPMPFPYGFNPGLGEPGTWSTSVSSMPSLNPNTLFPSSGFGTVGNGEQLLQDHMFNHSSGVAVTSNAYLGGLNQNSSGLNSNAFLNQPALYFPGSSTEISWGEQTHPSTTNPLLTEFYQPPPPPNSEPSSFNVMGVNIESLNGKEYRDGNVESALSNLSIGVDSKQTDDDKINCSSAQSAVSQPTSAAIVSSSGVDSKPKPVSWAAIASQPAKPKPKPPPPKPKLPPPPSAGANPGKSDSGSWGNAAKAAASKTQNGRNAQRPRPATGAGGNGGLANISSGSSEMVPVLERLKAKHNYNAREFSLSQRNARFFIIKSYSEDDIHRSIKYSVWTSTEHGNRRLNEAFREQMRGGGPIYLLVSVNGSGHFCGVAQMMSEVDLDIETGIWSQDKWKGKFDVKWYYVKDVPNNALRHIRLENNDNKPVTNSRDTQEVPPEKAKQVLKIIHSYKHQTSIFDDFGHYEKRQEEEFKKGNKRTYGVKEP